MTTAGLVSTALPRTLSKVRSRFPDDAACLDYLAQLRWQGGFSCPRCQGAVAWIASDGLRICGGCARRTSITAGTTFDRTRTPLPTWFEAAWLAANDDGINAVRLRDAVGLATYETAWAWLHKLRRAMADPIPTPVGGHGLIVETARVSIAGVSRGNMWPGRATIPVLMAVQISGGKPNQIKLAMSYQSSTSELHAFAGTAAAEGSQLHATPLATIESWHPSDSLDGVRQVASGLERWLVSTLYHGVAASHLAYYLDEFAFRFNYRGASKSARFEALLARAVTTSHWPIADLTNP